MAFKNLFLPSHAKWIYQISTNNNSHIIQILIEISGSKKNFELKNEIEQKNQREGKTAPKNRKIKVDEG